MRATDGHVGVRGGTGVGLWKSACARVSLWAMERSSTADFRAEKSRPLTLIGVPRAMVQCGAHDDARLAPPGASACGAFRRLDRTAERDAERPYSSRQAACHGKKVSPRGPSGLGRDDERRKKTARGTAFANSGTRKPPMPIPSASRPSQGRWDGGRLPLFCDAPGVWRAMVQGGVHDDPRLAPETSFARSPVRYAGRSSGNQACSATRLRRATAACARSFQDGGQDGG